MNDLKTPATTILLVEDDQLLNKTIQKLLQREGFTTEGFLNGKAALERISVSSGDVLLLLDYTLPDMNGKELIAKMRERGLDIPFVIITGHGDEQLAVEMMKLGAQDYIVKSLQFHEVVPVKIRHVCGEIADKRKLARAEEAVKMAASEWQKTFDSIADAVFICDSELRITRCNRETLLLLGKPMEEVIGTNCCKAIHCGAAPVADCPVVRMKRSMAREYGEMALGDRFFSITTDPIVDAGNSVIGTVHVLSDITGRKQAQIAMEKSEMEFRRLFESSVMGISEALPDGRLIRVNKAYATMYGYESPEQIMAEVSDIGRQLYASPEDRQAVIQILKEHGLMEPKEMQVVKRDGTLFYIMASAREIRDSSGNLLCYQATHMDISARKMVEEALRESEQRLNEAQALGKIGNWEFDLASNKIEWSDEVYSIYERDKTLGPPTPEQEVLYFSESEAKILLETGSRVIETGNMQKYDLTANLPSGRKVFLSGSMRGIKNADGRVARIFGTIQDVTERKIAEEKQKKLEDQLRQSQKLEAIGQLASGVAHDFNNLLGGIMGNAELIKMHSGKDPILGRYSDVIVNSTAKAAGLTQQLLTFARKARVNFTRVNIHSGIENVIELLARTVDRRIEIEKQFNAVSCLVKGDSNMLENAFLNIAINARDAMPAGGTLSFTTDNVVMDKSDMPKDSLELAPGEYIRAAIRDSGTGMDEKTMKRIFEPFFTTKEVGKGTGLGLAAVYGCVRQHNGHVTVESEPGKGSTFIIYLPVFLENERHPVTAAPVCVMGKGNILIVDDEQVVGEVAVELLAEIGYTSTFINSAPGAIEYFKKNHGSVDAVMLDYIMPKMTGLEVFREFKRICPGVRVIIASGYSDEKQDALLREEGMSVFVNKPYSLSELSTVLARVIGK